MRTGTPRKRDSVLAPDFGFGVAPCLYDPGGKVMGRMSAVMDRAAAVIGILALAIAAGTHAQDARAQAPRSGGAITVLYAGDVDSIDPGVTYYSGGYQVSQATQRALVGSTPDGRAVPDMAAAMPDVSPDGRTVTVPLRAGVRFSPPANREVTSDDVRYAIERGFFRTVANPYVGIYFADIVDAKAGVAPGTRIPGIETPDPHTLIFHLSQGTGRLLAGALALTLSAPVPRDYAAALDAHNPSTYGANQVATGPYMIANDAQGRTVGYRPGHEIRLVRNPNWDRTTDVRPAYLDSIEIREGNTNTAAAARRTITRRGLVIGAFAAPAGILRRALRHNRSQVHFGSGGGFNYAPLNTRIAPLNRVNVRRAINAAVDRRAIAAAAGGSTLTIARHIIPPGVPGFQEAGGYKRAPADFMAGARAKPRLAARYMRR